MIETVMNTIANACYGLGSLIEGIFGKQPNIDDLRKQVVSLREGIDQLEEVFREQAKEIDLMVAHYHNLKFYQFAQRSALKKSIQNELVCQYAALDYLTILINTVENGEKLSREDLDFYHTYCKVFADGQVDAEEMQTLSPLMWGRHGGEIDALQRCNLDHTLARIRNYKLS